MTIAVTGATGHLGALVIESLLTGQDPATLVAIVRDSQKAAPLADLGVAVRVADYNDVPALEAALTGVDTLLLISSSEVGHRVDQHRNVIDAAKSTGVERVVYTSAPHATTSDLVLAPDHKATEEHLVDSGLAYTIVRNNWYHENYLPQLDTVRETGILLAAAADGRVASASRRDYAEGVAVVLTEAGHEGLIHEFAGTTAWTYDDLAAALGTVVGREVVYKPVDAGLLVATLTGSGLDEGTAQFVAALDSNIAAGDLADADPTLTKLLGRPTTPLLETLRG